MLIFNRLFRCAKIRRNDQTAKRKHVFFAFRPLFATAAFKDKQAITLNDKEAGCIIISSAIDGLADHTGTLNRYVVMGNEDDDW